MKAPTSSVLLIFFLAWGCAHSANNIADHPSGDPSANLRQVVPASTSFDDMPESPPITVTEGLADPDYEEDLDYLEEDEAPKVEIADPLEPFNRVMYHVNDKLYFWVLKPAAKGYGKVVPENARISVRNFFLNIASPVRFVNCLLQANIRGAASEMGRFLVNTIWGIGGLLDPASSKDIDLWKQEGDFGQTLGVYGLGQGFFINWPLLGPSSARDTVGLFGDTYLHPLSYVAPGETAAGIRTYERVNALSLSLGDYETLKEAAIDPYVAIRDAYVQYRQKKVEAGRAKIK